MVWIYLVVALGAAVAGFVQGLSGFAFGMVAMSFWAWVLEPRLAATLAVFGALTGQIIAAMSVRRGFDAKRLLPFVFGGLLGVPLGVWLLPRLDMDTFKAALGTLLVLWCPVMLMAKSLPRIRRGGRWADGAVGAAGGVMAGIGGFSGTLPTLWCTLRGLEKEAQRAVIQNFNLSMLLVTMGTYIGAGIVTRDQLPFLAIVAAAMLLPVWLGAKLYIGLSEARFRQIVLGLLTVSGVALLAASVPRLLGRLG
ncbi:sulfite exporter TauE/SafE family protein [Variovorax sp. HJSM1_2]|uniref:sulfite exporter TauE/SafE family protein n=1 Tax=Variovorax sp. HJSM1_2 TaxID=3366263 RepID=UPI003BD9EBF9